jgi:predicted dehydrogenase/threonine dehydrogenase-like Zn-dependent dehydrogenase
MKQVLIKNGNAIVTEIPAPIVDNKSVLVKVMYSCVSVGTEMSSLKMSSLPLYKRALKQPENVKKVLEMIRNQGIQQTFERVSGKLTAGSPTGYSVAGEVIAVGEQVESFKIGDKVACAGAGIANHAEYVNVPVNLVTHIPENLSMSSASTVTLGAIAMQGVRRMQPTLGETIVVIGLGVLGQLTVQLLKANGCKVIGIDLDQSRVDTALYAGMDKGATNNSDLIQTVDLFTGGIGADGVIITASSESNEIVSLSMQITRKKGRVVLVGDVGLDLKRADFYVKELDFFISTSYGPGRYDPYYEEGGMDYPIGYVRWTENRNMTEYLYLLSSKKINIENFYSENIYSIDKAFDAFESLKMSGTKPLMVLLEYNNTYEKLNRKIFVENRKKINNTGKINVAIVGAGSFVLGMHLPNMQSLPKYFNIHAIMSRTGSNAKAIAQQYNAEYATTDFNEILRDERVNLVMITTRHDLHANMVLEALKHGKHVFVEKPLAINNIELDAIKLYLEDHPELLLITGFNRRFAPILTEIKPKLEKRTSPIMIQYIMNAGYINKDHWVHGSEGGGRNIGEACHIYDLFNYLTGSKMKKISACSLNVGNGKFLKSDNFNVTIEFEDGSICNLIYTALGSKINAKEEMAIFFDGSVIRLSDYKNLDFYGTKHTSIKKSIIDKGQLNLLTKVAKYLAGEEKEIPITIDEQIRATEISFLVEKLIKN